MRAPQMRAQLADALGSVFAQANELQAVTASTTYSPYGQHLSQEGNSSL